MWDVWKDGHGSKLIPLMPNNRGIKRAYILKKNLNSPFSKSFEIYTQVRDHKKEGQVFLCSVLELCPYLL
jgi:hypothetical protein